MTSQSRRSLQFETVVVDGDGLRLGGFGEPPQLHYPGTGSIIQPAALQDADGHLHFPMVTTQPGRHPWPTDNQSLKKAKTPCRLAKRA
jgi:hypothetical protein